MDIVFVQFNQDIEFLVGDKVVKLLKANEDYTAKVTENGYEVLYDGWNIEVSFDDKNLHEEYRRAV